MMQWYSEDLKVVKDASDLNSSDLNTTDPLNGSLCKAGRPGYINI